MDKTASFLPELTSDDASRVVAANRRTVITSTIRICAAENGRGRKASLGRSLNFASNYPLLNNGARIQVRHERVKFAQSESNKALNLTLDRSLLALPLQSVAVKRRLTWR